MNKVAEKIVKVFRESYRLRASTDLTDAERFMEDIRQAFIKIFGESLFKQVVFELAEYYGFDVKAEEAHSLFYADCKEEEDSPPYVEPGTTIEEVK